MKNKKLFIRSLYLLIIVSAAGCYYDKEELLYPGSNNQFDCSTVSAQFNADVLPLITVKCAVAGCHDATGSGGVILNNYLKISSVADRIKAAVVARTMPKTGSLTLVEINILKCWIDAGAQNN